MMQDWWSPSEIAEAALPDLPGTKRRVNALIDREGWQAQSGRARRRKGNGGGWEYHRSLFPPRAIAHLFRQDAPAPAVEAPRERSEVWAEFEKLPEKTRAKAAERLAIIQGVELLVEGGLTKHSAVQTAARNGGVSPRSIWNWFDMIEAVRRDDRLAYLVPRHRLAKRKVARTDCTDDAWEAFKADFLRLSGPAFSACYRRLERLSKDHKWVIPPERTLRRKVDREIPRDILILGRKGPRALAKLYPAQVRDKSHLHAMEIVNADYHTWDVRVMWDGEIVRPLSVMFGDIHSGKILSCRHDKTANTSSVQLSFGDMVERYGIPEHCVLDNGREFSSKWFTAGAATRFRGKIKEDDVPGTLISMGIKVHWTTPYHGQAKPIERTFRDLCETVAKDPRFEGAYTGNSPVNKPENYGKRAIDFDVFCAVVEEGIAEHNARTGRRSPTADGRSLDETFNASYERAQIRKCTDEQRRYWLLGFDDLRTDRSNGQIKHLGNIYWSPWLTGYNAQRVVIRFDPDNLFDGVHVYDASNAYLGFAECHEAGQFDSVADARNHGRAKRAYTKAVKEQRKALSTMDAAAVGRLLDGTPVDHAEPPVAKVIRPTFTAGSARTPSPEARPLTVDEEAAQDAIIARFEAPLKPAQTETEAAESRFRQAMDLEAKMAAGEPVDDASREWLEIYQCEPEYLSQSKLREDFPDEYFA